VIGNPGASRLSVSVQVDIVRDDGPTPR
jgi:hypothetical protein